MDVTLLDRIPLQLTKADAEKKLRVQDELREEFEDVFETCMGLIRPKAMYTVSPVSSEGDCVRVGGETFVSRVMGVNFSGLGRCFPAIATCGREIYEHGMKCDDVLEKFWIDGIAEMALGQAFRALRHEVRARYATGALRAMSPGSLPDFPITEQRGLFRLLGDPMARIGVALTDSCLMLPQKSGSSLLFESEARYENCSLCPREGCPNRRAPFDAEMRSGKYHLA